MDLSLINYLILINLAAVLVTLYDKWASRHAGSHRIRERHLFALAVLGGAAGMYLTMQIIRHKTRHPQFMWGLPLIFIIQAALYLWTLI